MGPQLDVRYSVFGFLFASTTLCPQLSLAADLVDVGVVGSVGGVEISQHQ